MHFIKRFVFLSFLMSVGFVYADEHLTVENLPQYNDEQLRQIAATPEPTVPTALPPLFEPTAQGTGKQVRHENEDGSIELLVYRPDTSLQLHIVFESTNSTRSNAIYYAPDKESKEFTRRLYDLRAGKEYFQRFVYEDNEFKVLSMISGFIVESRTDGGLGDFFLNYTPAFGGNVFWAYDVGSLGRKTRGYLYIGGKFRGFREFFYEGNSKDRRFIRSWNCQRNDETTCRLELSSVSEAPTH